jgi:phospholipase/carboxylesterase
MAAGLHALRVDPRRDTLLHVPATLRTDRPAPLLLTLHGAGGVAGRWIERVIPLADALGALLVAPTSADASWDVRFGDFGVDVVRIEAALAVVFGRFDVDPARLATHGFSDGASYALSLGLTNGDLFGRIVAHSPGFVVTEAGRGAPAVFVSHGTADPVLPIDTTSRRIVPDLRRQGYAVDYREFDGGHAIPPAVEAEARAWLERGWS